MTDTQEVPVVLYPLGSDEVIALSAESDGNPFLGLGETVFKLASSVGPLIGQQGSGVKGKVFTTTPEIEAMLDRHRTHGSAAGEGYFLPVMLDENGRFLRQVPLKEVDPALLAAAVNPAVLAVAAATQVIMARLDQLSEQIEAVGKNVKQILDLAHWQQRADVETRLRNIDDIFGRRNWGNLDWSTISHDRTALESHHRTIVQELESFAGGVLGKPNLEEGWRTLDPDKVTRIRHLIGLDCRIIQSLAKWTAIKVELTPLDDSTEQVVVSERRRLDDTIAELSKAVGRFPESDIEEFWSFWRVVHGGYPGAFKNWQGAHERRRAVLGATGPIQAQLTAKLHPPLELSAHAAQPNLTR